MNDDEESFLIYSKEFLSKIKIEEYQVLIGIHGFGAVGYLALTHMVETLDVKSFAYWGDSSWFYRNNIEALITAYVHEESKSIFVLTRVPIHVSSIPQRFWDAIVRDIIDWNAKRYIVIGGLRETTRSPTSTNWIAYAPSPKWTEEYNHQRNLNDKLLMIGPLSSLLLFGSAYEVPSLGMLVYCNFEEDPDATQVALTEIEEICNIEIPNKENLQRFDYSFIPSISRALFQQEGVDEDDDDDDVPGYDFDELI